MFDDMTQNIREETVRLLLHQDASSLFIDDLPLLVHDLIILQQILSDAEVIVLSLLLCRLKVIDRKWMDHIDDMDQLRQGAGLQAYAQKDPLVEYKMNGSSP